MKILVKCSIFILTFALIWSFNHTASGQKASKEMKPSVSILRVGSVNVESGQLIVLEDPVTDIFGTAWNYRNKTIYALVRPKERKQWYVAGSTGSEPGGVFNIIGAQFPQMGSFELIIIIPGLGKQPSIGSWMAENEWRSKTQAISQRVSVVVTSSPPNEGEERPIISILSVAGVSIISNEKMLIPVPSSGDVIVRALQLSDSDRIYLAIHVPYTDRCYIYGPAGDEQYVDNYVLRGITFEPPGDPQQTNLELLAFASSLPVRTGSIGWKSWQQAKFVASQTVEINVSIKRQRYDSERVPFIAITRIGQNILEIDQPANSKLRVDQGALIEVSAYERMPEGSRLWVLTRPSGSNVWLSQGPMIPRGSQSSELGYEPPLVTWVLPGIQFESPDQESKKINEYEIMAVLSTTTFPNSWVSSTYLSSESIETVSQILVTQVRKVNLPLNIRPSISRVCGKNINANHEVVVDKAGCVEVNVTKELPKDMNVYVGKHLLGSFIWSFVRTIPNGKTYVSPDISFDNPHIQEGTHYQLISIVTRDLLPDKELDQDFIKYVTSASEVVTVRYGKSGLSAILERISSSGQTFDEDYNEKTMGVGNMWWLWILLIFLGTTALLIILEWALGTVSYLSCAIAKKIKEGYSNSVDWFEPASKINPSYFLLGLTILGLVLYVIIRYYIRLYAAVLAEVTNLSSNESMGLAMWIILITALVGIFIDLASQFRKSESGKIHLVLPLILGLIALVLIAFQGGIYYVYFGKTGVGLLPILGGWAFLLISTAEIAVFYFITKLTLGAGGDMAIRLLRSPFVLLALMFSFMCKFFGTIPKRKQDTKTNLGN